MEDQKNLVLAIVLSSLVMLAWLAYGAKMAGNMQDQAVAEQALNAEIEAENPVDKVEPLQPREAVIKKGQRIKIDTPSLSGSFLVEGSRFDDISLKNYKKTLKADSSDVILLTPEGSEKAAYVFDNWTKADSGKGANTAWSVISGTTLTPSSPVVMVHAGEGFNVERTVTVDDRYLITLEDKVTNTSGAELSLSRKGYSRQHGLPDDLTNFFILHEGPISVVGGTMHDMKYKKLTKKKTVSHMGESGWVGITDKYWLAAAIAPQGKPMTANFNFRLLNDVQVYETGYELDATTLTPGATITSTGYVFAGAKDREVLLKYRDDYGIEKMDYAIDWGLLGILVRPMTWALSTMGNNFGNFGLAILALTLIIKIFLFPLFNKQYESQAKMKKVQPKLKKLQNLYKDDRMKLQQEMMGLYKKEGVNPAAGCLPIIPTIFVFFALYKTVLINVELRHAPFFGYIQDLSARDPLSILNGFGLFPWAPIPAEFLTFVAIGPLALLYGITMASIYTLTPQGGAGAGGEQAEMMAKMMKWMPWIFMFVLAGFEAGLLIYWVWNNILSFLQQYYITRKFKVDTPVDAFFRKIFKREAPETES